MPKQPQITAAPDAIEATVKLAPNHAKVYAALREAARPVTAYELIDAVRASGISAPPTVYRALNKLIELGLAHRLESLNAFVACSYDQDHLGSVIFMICDTCGETREVVNRSVDKYLRQTSGDCAFHVEQTTIELRGHCALCETKAHAGEIHS